MGRKTTVRIDSEIQSLPTINVRRGDLPGEATTRAMATEKGSKSRGTNPKEELKDFQREQARREILKQRAIDKERASRQRFKELLEKVKREAQIKAGKVQPSKSQPLKQGEEVAQLKGQTHVVTKTPSFVESYKSYIKDRNPFTASYGFAIEKLGGIISKQEEKFTPKGQKIFGGETGKSIKTGIKVAPYFIPQTAPTFLVGAGIGALTSGGIKESITFGKSVKEKTNITALGVGASVGYTGLQVGGGVFGGKALVGQTEKALGLSKLDTTFIAKNKLLSQTDNLLTTQTTTKAITTKSGLTPARTFASKSTSKTDILLGEGLQRGGVSKSGGDIFSFKTTTKGLTSEVTPQLDLVTGKSQFGTKPGKTTLDLVSGRMVKKPSRKEFISGTIGEGRLVDKNILIGKSNGLEATKTFEGFNFISASKMAQQTGKTRISPFGKVSKTFTEPSDFIGGGTGAKVSDDWIISAGKTQEVNFPKAGTFRQVFGRAKPGMKGDSFGVTKLSKEQPKTNLFLSRSSKGGGLGDTQLRTSLQSGVSSSASLNIQKSVMSQLATEQATKIKTAQVFGSTKSFTSGLPTQTKQSFNLPTQTKQQSFNFPTQTITQPTKQKIKQVSIQRLGYGSITKQRGRLGQLSRSGQAQGTRQARGTAQILRQAQVTKRKRTFGRPNTRVPPGTFFKPRIIFFNGFKLPTFSPSRKTMVRQPTTIRPFRPPRRSPSLLAITQGIWSKTPFRPERSGIGIRPMLFEPTKKKKKKRGKR